MANIGDTLWDFYDNFTKVFYGTIQSKVEIDIKRKQGNLGKKSGSDLQKVFLFP